MIRLRIIELRRDRLKNINIFLTVLFSILVIFFAVIKETRLINISVITLFSFIFISSLYSLSFIPYKELGRIEFYTDKILIKQKEGLLCLYSTDILSFKINYSGYAGETFFLSKGFNNGCENFITITTNNNEYHFRILFENKNQYSVLKKITSNYN